jgi:7,8-dihydropterin-6-yl-methyl-4-(beta-D-ribofuranosyl)aminobenzene 5'-phosphate synthase
MNRSIPVHLHPDAFLSRRLKLPVAPGPVGIPRLDKAALERAEAEVVVSRYVSPLAGGMLTLTGEIKRITSFEKGFPGAEAEIGGSWVPDPFRDDQALVAHIRGKGLVVISGCAHAGIINTVEHAKRVTGIDRVHAVLGGFHLTGPLFAPVIPPTIAGMQAINPDYIIPMHCTGWDAITRFAAAMPGKFILNTVGTSYCFNAE